jgi:acyl-CoA synthetase (NDP forming)
MLAGMATIAARGACRSEPKRFQVQIEEARNHLVQLRAANRVHLGMLELQPVLDAYGIRCAAVRQASTAAGAAAVAASLGFPVAIKVQSTEISHKTEVGGVRLNLRSVEEVAMVAAEMLQEVRVKRPTAVIDGVLVQRMAGQGKELLLGLVQDPQFGPLVMAGFGGIYVEVLKDISARLAPLALSDAREMLDELRMAPLLHGVRGEQPVDVVALCETVCRFAQIGAELPDLLELEVNPLVSSPGGAVAVDARARLSEGGSHGHSKELRKEQEVKASSVQHCGQAGGNRQDRDSDRR